MPSSPLPTFGLAQLVAARLHALNRTAYEHAVVEKVNYCALVELLNDRPVTVDDAIAVLQSVGFHALAALADIRGALGPIPITGDQEMRLLQNPEQHGEGPTAIGDIVLYHFDPESSPPELRRVKLLQPYSFLTQKFVNTHLGLGWLCHGAQMEKAITAMVHAAARGDAVPPLVGRSSIEDPIELRVHPPDSDGLVPLTYSVVVEPIDDQEGFAFKSLGPTSTVFVTPDPTRGDPAAKKRRAKRATLATLRPRPLRRAG